MPLQHNPDEIQDFGGLPPPEQTPLPRTDIPQMPPPDLGGLQFLTNAGKNASARDMPGGGSGYVAYDPNARYQLVDESGRGNRIVYSGTGVDALDTIFGMTQEMSKSGGTKADWQLQRFDPSSQTYKLVADDDPKNQTLGKIADYALPALLAAGMMIPGVNAAVLGAIGLGGLTGAGAAAAGAGLAGALGSGISSAAQGRSLEDSLLRAAIAGGGSALGAGVLGPAMGGAFSGVGSTSGAVAGDVAANAAANAAANEILVLGNPFTNLIGNALGSTIGGGVGGLGGSLLPSGGSAAPPPQTAPVEDFSGNFIPVTGQLPSSLGGSLAVDAGLGAGGGALASTLDQDIANNVIRVTDQTTPPQQDLAVPVPPLPLDPSGGFGPNQSTTPDATTPDDKGKLGLNDISRILKLVSLVGGLGGSALEGGKKNLMPGGLNTGLSPIFSGQLPGASGVLGIGSASGPRTMPAQDWTQYGMRPEQSFYNSVPSLYTPPAPGVEDPNWPRGSRGYAVGGAVEYAGGGPLSVRPGGGRADDVPAMLSNGEYVIDAETVALLGNGDFDEGSRKLDSLRVNVRKHKGRDLAKGRISPTARPAERYLGVM